MVAQLAKSPALQQLCAPVTASSTVAVVLQSGYVCATAALLVQIPVFLAEHLGERNHVGAAYVNVSQKNSVKPASIKGGKKEQKLSWSIGRVGGPGLVRTMR